MNNPDKVKAAASMLGRQALGKPKTLTDEQREWRRVWARQLATIRAQKRHNQDIAVMLQAPATMRVIVIDRHGRKWPYRAESVQHAVTKARADGIDAVGGRAEQLP